MQPLTVPGNLCLAHLQWLSKPKNQKKQKNKKKNKKNKKTRPNTLHLTPSPWGVQSCFFCFFLVFLFFWFFGFLVFCFFGFFGFSMVFCSLAKTSRTQKKTKKNKKFRPMGKVWAIHTQTEKPKNQKTKKPRNQKNKKPKNQKKNKKTKIAHPKGRGSDAECWVLSFWFFWFFWFFGFLVFWFFGFLVFWFFGFLVSWIFWFFGFLVCVWKNKKNKKKNSPDLAHGSGLFFLFFLCSGGFGQTAKNHGKTKKTKKKVQTHVPCQASPQTLPMGLNFFFVFFVFSIVVLNVFHVKMLSSQYLSKKCASLQFAHLRPPGQTAKKSMEKPKFI